MYIDEKIKNFLNLLACFFVLAGFLVTTQNTKAYGSPDYLPNGAHPRIFLTPTRITELQAKVAANDPDWLAVKADADQMLTYTVPAYDPNAKVDGTIYYNYEGAGWYKAIITLGLAYQFTGNTAYADKLKQIIDVIDAAGNAPIQVDSGYPTRYLPSGMALAYDWLYNYLDANTKTAMISTINNWYDWYKASAYNRTDSTGAGNYYGGHLFGFGLAGLATYGENTRADEINQYFQSKWNTDVVLAFTSGAFSGGYAIESYCRYGADNFQRLLEYAEATNDATGENMLGNFGNRIATGLIYNLKPNGWQSSDEGTQSGNTGWVMYGGLPMILSNLLSGSDANQMAYYFNNLAATPISSATTSLQQPADYDAFVFKTSRSPEDYTLTRPLFYRSLGDEHVFVRSDWTSNAVWSAFRGGSVHYASHQQQNAGNINIQRGNDYLLVNAGQWRGTLGYTGSPSSDFISNVASNTLYFNDGGVYTNISNSLFDGGQEWYGINNVLNFEGNLNYVYEKADLTSAYYSGAYGVPISARTLTYFHRNFVALSGGADVVVYDRIKATDASYTKRLQWYLNPQSNPVINGTLVTSDVGNSRLHIKTVYPTDASINVATNPTSMKGTIYGKRLEVSLGTPNTDFNPLTVLLSTDNSTSTPQMTGIDTANMQGVVISETTPKIVLFSKDGTQQNSASYSATSGNHILVDMQPGAYDVYQDSVKVQSGIAASAQGVLSFSATGGTNFRIVKSGVNPNSFNVSNFLSLTANWLRVDFNNSSDFNSDNIVNTKDLGIMMSKWN